MSCPRCEKLEAALRALYEHMQAPPGEKRRENIDRVLGLVHDVLPEMVEADQDEQRRRRLLDGRGRG